jgi:hypothetical protein
MLSDIGRRIFESRPLSVDEMGGKDRFELAAHEILRGNLLSVFKTATGVRIVTARDLRVCA